MQIGNVGGMQIGHVGGTEAAQSATGMPPLSDAGSILAQSLVSEGSEAFADGFAVDLSAAALAGE